MSNDTRAVPTDTKVRSQFFRLTSARRWLTANDDANTYRLCLALFLVGTSLGLPVRDCTPIATARAVAQEVSHVVG